MRRLRPPASPGSTSVGTLQTPPLPLACRVQALHRRSMAAFCRSICSKPRASRRWARRPAAADVARAAVFASRFALQATLAASKALRGCGEGMEKAPLFSLEPSSSRAFA